MSTRKKVQVYISASLQNSNNIKGLNRLFCRSYFDVHIKSIPVPSVPTNNINSYRFMEIMKHSYKKTPESYVLYLKDNSVTSSNSETIKKVIKTAIKDKGWDLLYMCRWLDRCDLYNKMKDTHRDIPGTSIKLTRTISPNGIQSILFSPKGLKKLLGYTTMRNKGSLSIKDLSNRLRLSIESGELYALATIPNIFSYNILDADSMSDLAKMVVCRRPVHIQHSHSNNNISPMIWFFVVVIVSIMILGALYYLGAKNSNIDKKKREITH